jgi:hypothetical protein
MSTVAPLRPRPIKAKRRTTLVRLPPDLYETLQKSADANCRSVAQEIQYRLMRDLKTTEVQP